MAARTFPMFHPLGRQLIVCREPFEPSHEGLSAPFFVAKLEGGQDLRSFIIEACNTHSSITVESARLQKARADLAEQKLREALGEPAPAEFGFYAGLSLDKLSVGPHPTFDAALDAARHEHGASASIFVVEAKPAEVDTNVFGSLAINRVLRAIEDANAFPVGPDAILPPMRQHHEEDLAKRLNTAVRQWMTANGIKLITASLGEARSHTVVIPHEVDSVTTRPVSAPAGGALKPTIVVADEVDPYPLADTSPHGSMCCTECRSPMRCAEEGCNAGYVSRFEPVRVEDPGFHTWAAEMTRPAPVATPAGPHTGDMNAMLDDLGGASC